MRFHKIANVNKALDFIASKGVNLVYIGAEGEEGTRGKDSGESRGFFYLQETVEIIIPVCQKQMYQKC